MLLAVDVCYHEEEDLARVAGLLFADWTAATAELELTRTHGGLRPYRPGAFFERELPCILPLIAEVRSERALAAIIVDGYVDLGGGHPGLGRHLFDALEGGCSIVGVAKSEFRGAEAVPLLRGTSRRPLWVSATDDPKAAAGRVASMHGESRMPTLLRAVDQLARAR